MASCLESLREIKLKALRVEPSLEGRDEKGVEKASYEDLVDRFYQVSEHLAPHQYEAAKKDFEYFMRLLDLAMAYYRDGVEEGKGGNGG